MKKIKLLNLVFCTVVLLISSCSNDDEQPTTTVLEISQEIKELIYFIGDEESDTVVINVQAGPDTELSTFEVDFIAENLSDNDFLTVNIQQAQTLNSGLITDSDITFEEAITIDAETVEILNEVIQYFKGQGRTVYVFGQSFGAFVTQELIAQKGIDVADKYLIMIGRLDMNDVIWQGLSEGRYGFFENGINPILDDEIASDVIERNLAKLAAGFGKNRYTELFNDFPDLSKITYIYGRTDEAVGSLTEAEEQFFSIKKCYCNCRKRRSRRNA